MKKLFITLATILVGATPASANWNQFHQLVNELKTIPAVQMNYANMCRERYGMMTSTGYRAATGPNYQWCLSTYNSNINPW